MISKIIRIVLVLPVIIFLLLIVTINVRIYYSPDVEISGQDTINADLLKQLRGLKYSLDNGGDHDMQQLYPEGFMFTNALYGLAWCNFIKKLDPNSPYVGEGKIEIQNAWNKMDSNDGRDPFNEYQPIPYGAFYTGWSTYVLGKKLSLESISERDTNEVNYFKEQCRLITNDIKEHVYPVSYPESAWPADGVLCMAVLSLHDKIYSPQHEDVIDDWIKRVKVNLDPLGLIPHAADHGTGKAIENARGSSQGLMLLFLKEIDEEFAREQFAIYKDNFLDEKTGLTGIREYPKNDFGIGDVDSGPLLLQMGASATLVGIQTLNAYGDYRNGVRIRKAVEAFSFPFKKGDGKIYLFGFLPIADAFIAWSDSSYELKDVEDNFWTFHLYSAILALISILLIWYLWRPKNPSSERSLHIPW